MPPKTDHAWERWGRENPYYGVLTDEKYLGHISPDAKREFLGTGEIWISRVLATINQRMISGFRPKAALDFGCGTGRLVLPLARICDRVLGLDVSAAMLREARANVDAAALKNVALLKSDDSLSGVEGEFDLIHSFIVFQHIPEQRGIRIVRRLLELLSPGGVVVLQFTYGRDASLARQAINWLRHRVPPLHGLINRVRGRPFFEPPMQMNSYNLNAIMHVFHTQGIEKMFAELARSDEYRSITLFGLKNDGSAI